MGILGDIFSSIVKDLEESDSLAGIYYSAVKELKRDFQMQTGRMK